MDLPIHWVAEIFKEFRRLYLHRFTSAIEGDEAGTAQTWARKLAHLTGDEIRRGLDNLPSDWPPTADDFVKCCKGCAKNDLGLDWIPPALSTFRITDRSRLLSSDARDAERAAIRPHFDAMRKILR